jgi:hypothetical protein
LANTLLSLLGGSGIEAKLDVRAGRKVYQARVLVLRSDVDRTLPLINDFKQGGKKAEH